MVPLPRVPSHRLPFVGRRHPTPPPHHLRPDMASTCLRESLGRYHCIEASRLGAIALKPLRSLLLTLRCDPDIITAIWISKRLFRLRRLLVITASGLLYWDWAGIQKSPRAPEPPSPHLDLVSHMNNVARFWRPTSSQLQALIGAKNPHASALFPRA